MARHKAPRTPVVRRSMAVLATAGAALGVAAATASAAEAQVLPVDAGHVCGTVSDVKPKPLGGPG
ncbi:hypothetical protein ACFTY7_46505, partial [Streptomyces sp. NPDC057062]